MKNEFKMDPRGFANAQIHVEALKMIDAIEDYLAKCAAFELYLRATGRASCG